MQAGFAFLGAGFIRAKNTVNYLTKSFLDFCMASLSYWAFGFALMWGGSKAASGLDDGNAIIGYSGFFLTGDAYDVDTILSWFFQMVFAATAATIVAGAVAERTKVTCLPRLQLHRRRDYLPDLRPLGLGWWLARQPRARNRREGLCR